jgi:hypothetical protein
MSTDEFISNFMSNTGSCLNGHGYGCGSGDGYGWGEGSGKCLVDGSERGWCDDWGDVFGFGYGRGSCP